MDYNELTRQLKVLEKERDKIERSIEAKAMRCVDKMLALKMKYIEEHKPLPLKRYQRIKVVARVTEESRKRMTEERRNMKKYRLGATYTLAGIFNGYGLDEKRGAVIPCFYGGTQYRGMHDEVLSVKLADIQPDGDCNKCRKAKDGYCYMAGGMERGKKWAIWKIDEEKMVPCPRYEEVVEGGLYGIKGKISPARHYRNVTRVMTEDGKWKYRLYGNTWNYFSVYDEEEIKKYYTREPQDYGEE